MGNSLEIQRKKLSAIANAPKKTKTREAELEAISELFAKAEAGLENKYKIISSLSYTAASPLPTAFQIQL
jgi:hypothetical protein